MSWTMRSRAAASRQKERRERTARLRTISTPMPWREGCRVAGELAGEGTLSRRKAGRADRLSQLALEPWTQPC
jgi:hypothetical protein